MFARPDRLKRTRLAIALCAWLGLLAGPAIAQNVVAPQLDSAALHARLAPTMAAPNRPMPEDAGELDTLLRQDKLGALSNRLRTASTAQAILQDMDWEQAQILDGAGFIISYAYLFDLWRLGSALPGEKGNELKQSAGMMFLYNLDLITLDGLKCEDATAPAHRRDQLFSQNPALIAYMRSLPRATRMTFGTISLGIEAATAPLRKDDPVLCSGGLAQMSQSLQAQAGKPLQQVPNAPGAVGKTYAVPPAPGYQPRFTPEAEWRAKQAVARQKLAPSLTRLLTLPSDTPAPAAPSR